MTRPSTGMDMQRVTFVESLHSSLKKQASKAIADHKKYASLAKSYLDDGLEDTECVELLMIDGLSREAAESYADMVKSETEAVHDDQNEYSFQFEDEYGKVWSSYDIGRSIRASNDEEAWEKAEEILEDGTQVEAQKLISVNRIG